MPFSETVLLSRHVKTAEHHNYLTQVAITDVLDPSTPPPKAADAMGRSAQNFVVEVVVTRGDEQRRACTRGRDGYAVTAPLTGEAVERLIKGKIPLRWCENARRDFRCRRAVDGTRTRPCHIRRRDAFLANALKGVRNESE